MRCARQCSLAQSQTRSAPCATRRFVESFLRLRLSCYVVMPGEMRAGLRYANPQRKYLHWRPIRCGHRTCSVVRPFKSCGARRKEVILEGCGTVGPVVWWRLRPDCIGRPETSHSRPRKHCSSSRARQNRHARSGWAVCDQRASVRPLRRRRMVITSNRIIFRRHTTTTCPS